MKLSAARTLVALAAAGALLSACGSQTTAEPAKSTPAVPKPSVSALPTAASTPSASTATPSPSLSITSTAPVTPVAPAPPTELEMLKGNDWKAQQMLDLAVQESDFSFGSINQWKSEGSKPVLIGVDYTKFADASGTERAQALLVYTDESLQSVDGPSTVGMQLFGIKDGKVSQIGAGTVSDYEGQANADSYFIFHEAFSLTKDGIFVYTNQASQGYQTPYRRWKADQADAVESGYSNLPNGITWIGLSVDPSQIDYEKGTDGSKALGETELPPKTALPFSPYEKGSKKLAALPPVNQPVTEEEMGD